MKNRLTSLYAQKSKIIICALLTCTLYSCAQTPHKHTENQCNRLPSSESENMCKKAESEKHYNAYGNGQRDSGAMYK